MRIASARTNKDPTSPWAQDTSKEARLRNRYADIWPWANSRVRLKVPEGESDYINASPILLCCSKTGDERKYIATQVRLDTGPRDQEHL
jgi:protein-tyrosine phosphatase